MLTEVTARNDYIGNGTTTAFAYTFRVLTKADLEVLLAGVVKTVDTDYTVSGLGAGSGGTVTFLVAPASGVAVALLRKQPLAQASDYVANEDFPAERLEKDLDKLAMVSQQFKEMFRRSLGFAKKSILTDPILPDGVVGKLLRWKTTTELENVDSSVFVTGSVALPVSIANGGTSAATAAAARSSLAVPGLAEENTFTARQHWAKGADVAAAATLTPGTGGNYFHVTGTTTISAIAAAAAGSTLLLEFDSALTLTHNATSLILQGSTNLTVAAGDVIEFVSEGSGNWREKSRRVASVSVGDYCVRRLVGQNDATTPNTKFGYSADLVVLRNPTDGSVIARTNTGTLTNDTAVAGSTANGRDQGAAFGSATWIHFYFIWNGTTLATLSSTTAPPTGPTLPTGYTHWAYATAVRYDATPVLVRTRVVGAWAYYEAEQNALTNGTAIVETAVALSTLVPPNALRAQLRVNPASSVAGSTTNLRLVSGSANFYLVTINAAGGNTEQFPASLLVQLIAQQKFYINSSASLLLTLDVQGYSLPNGGE